MVAPLVVNVAELLRRPATQKAVHSVTPADGLKVVDSRSPTARTSPSTSCSRA